MQIKIGQHVAIAENCSNARNRPHKHLERRLDREQHFGTKRRNELRIAHKLDRVTQTLFSVKQDGLPMQVPFPIPAGLREVAVLPRQILSFPAVLILFPAGTEIPNDQPRDGRVEIGVGIVWFERKRLAIAGQRLVHPHLLEERIPTVNESCDDLGFDTKRMLVARERFVESIHFGEGCTAIREYARLVGLDRKRPIVTLQCLYVSPVFDKGLAAVSQSRDVIGLACYDFIED